MSINKKTIFIDLDDTLNTLVPDWLVQYNQEFLDNLQQKDILSWDIGSYVKPEAKEKFYEYLIRDTFFKNLGIQPYAKEVTKWLSEYYELYIVTAYHPKTCWNKAQWVEKHLSHINTKRIIFCNYKGLLKGEYMIDDGNHNISDFHETNPFGLPIVFDKPWNQESGNKFIRVKDWLEIKEWFQEWLKQDTE